MTIRLADLSSNPPPTDAPVLIGDRLWWVGHHLPGDPFQCHAYLLEQGDQSVLFDPGSRLTFKHTLAKIQQIVPLQSVKWFVCHHQDPDITGAMPLIDLLVNRPDARLVTHWRAEALLKHLGLNLPFWRVEDHDWRLPLADRTLTFVFTPYAHFPGAFTTFEPTSGTLLSSDLFGGFTEGAQLEAQDLGYFEAMRPFHEHYIPSREVLGHAIAQVRKLPLRQIAPQHGCIIPERLVNPMLDLLAQLECGLYLLDVGDSDVRRLSHLSRLIREATRTLLDERDFKTVSRQLTKILAEVMPVSDVEYFVYSAGDDDGPTDDNEAETTAIDGEAARPFAGQTVLHLSPEGRYRGTNVVVPEQIRQVMTGSSEDVAEVPSGQSCTLRFGVHAGLPGMIVPMLLDDTHHARAVAVFRLTETAALGQTVRDLLQRIGPAIEVAVEREALHRALELERDRLYQRSIQDPLTQLYTRRHMQDVVSRWVEFQNRDPTRVVSVVMLDLDHFKLVNDTLGHGAGDTVLKRVAGILRDECRSGDLAVRMGGEEFALFLFGSDPGAAKLLAERVGERVRTVQFAAPLDALRVTISAGATSRRDGETLTETIERADRALYGAKHGGRDQVQVD